MEFEWKMLDDFKVDNGVITGALYGCFGRDGSFMKEHLNTIVFDDYNPATAVPFENVTRDMVAEWVVNKLGAAEVERIQTYVAALVNGEKSKAQG